MTISEEELARHAAVRSWLESGAAFGGRRPEVITTPGNLLFLTPDLVYKMKRVIDFGWMDFSTLAKREAACRRELLLNRRTAPDIYLAVKPVVRRASGGFALGGEGDPVEWLVEMRRFDEAKRLDHLLDRGALPRETLLGLADAVAALHAAAETAPGQGGAESLASIARENAEDMAQAPGLFPRSERQGLLERSLAILRARAGLTNERDAAGWVRHCHGDLHLANIVLWEGKPTPFDCIEFNEDFARIDVLYDLAFLLMDLDHRGQRALANLLLNRWLAMMPEPAVQLRGLALLPIFLSLRAGVRAKMSGYLWLEQTPKERRKLADRARHYLGLARGYLEPGPPRVVAVGGLSGSGKSTLAAALAPVLGAAPGAVHLRSDVLRKRLFGVTPEVRLPPDAYSDAWHDKVAQALLDHAEVALRAGQSVVLDAVNGEQVRREAIGALAERLSLPFDGLWLEAPLEVMMARVQARSGDASDATPAVVESQSSWQEPPVDWLRIDASGPAEAVLSSARALLDDRTAQDGKGISKSGLGTL